MSDRTGLLDRLRELLAGRAVGAGEASADVPSPPYGEDETPPGCEETEEISCREAAERVYEYLDGELAEEEAEEVRCHVEKCKECYPMYNWERMFLDFVHSRAAREEPNPELRESIENLLEREENGDRSD